MNARRKKKLDSCRTGETVFQQRWSPISPLRSNICRDASQRKSKFGGISWKLPLVSFGVSVLWKILGSSGFSRPATQPNQASPLPPAFGRWKYIPHPGWHGLYRSSLSFDLRSINNHRELKKMDLHIRQSAALINDATDPIKRPPKKNFSGCLNGTFSLFFFFFLWMGL